MGFNRRRKQCRNYFGGTFDGQGHIVKNLTCTSPGNGAYGFLGVISQTGTVQNLGIVNANLQTPSNAASTNMGILADWANQAKVINCYTTGVVSSAHQSGGFQLVGGLIGQWENATEDAVIWDSYFDGSIVCEYTDVGVGGILGANFDFRGMPGVTIRNCFVSTTDITCAEPGNITWIAAVVDSEVTNCYWPVSPDAENPYAAVVKLILDPGGSSASADPNFDASICGAAVASFASEEILSSLQANAAQGVTWIIGMNGPAFQWDKLHISAVYTEVEKAIAQANALNREQYQNFEIIDEALASVVYGLDSTRQSEVDAMAQVVLDAIADLVYKDANYTKVDEAIAKAEALNKDEYKDFLGVDAAINGVVRNKNITQQDEVDAMAQAIKDAIAGLEKKEEIPVNPTEPTTPGDSGTINGSTEHGSTEHGSVEQGMNSPQTGDNSNTVIWITVAVLAAGVMTGTFVVTRKRKSE